MTESHAEGHPPNDSIAVEHEDVTQLQQVISSQQLNGKLLIPGRGERGGGGGGSHGESGEQRARPPRSRDSPR
eukprot:scaffold1446_cov175-Ochromonas_danica.AAC.15